MDDTPAFFQIFSIPTDSLLLLFLNLCRELRDFCGFTKVPDASLLSRFKLDFEPYIEQMFQQMVDFTELICQLIDSSLPSSQMDSVLYGISHLLMMIPLNPTIWNYACSPEFNGIRKSGTTPIRSAPLWNVPSITSKSTCALPASWQSSLLMQ